MKEIENKVSLMLIGIGILFFQGYKNAIIEILINNLEKKINESLKRQADHMSY